MPHMTAVARRATDRFRGLPDQGLRDELLPVLREATELLDGLDADVRADAEMLLDAVPGSVAGALLGAVRSATERNVPVTFVWQAAYDFEVRVWESVNAEGVGGATVMLTSPFPRHVRERADG